MLKIYLPTVSSKNIITSNLSVFKEKSVEVVYLFVTASQNKKLWTSPSVETPKVLGGLGGEES